MDSDLAAEAPPQPAPPDRSLVRWPLAAAAVGLVAQVALTDYGPSPGARFFWLVLGVWLLWLVWARRSGVARLLLGASAAIGMVIYLVGAVTGDLRSLWIALVDAVQVAGLLLPVVHRHVKVVKAVG